MNPKSPGWWLRMTRGEHAGAFYLLVAAMLVGLIPVIRGSLQPPEPMQFRYDSVQLAKLYQRHQAAADSFYKKQRTRKINLSKAEPEDLMAIGISEDRARHLWQTIRSGKRYRSFEELSREAGVDTAQLARIISKSSFGYDRNERESPKIIELNQTDTSALIALPGIGSKTALRIIRYRDALGGFISSGQILETFGVDTVTLKKLMPRFSVNASMVRKLEINRADEKQLEAHPYISDRQARVIVAYRQQHGNMKPEDLEKIKVISPAQRLRMLPYLAF